MESYVGHGYLTVGGIKNFIEKHQLPDDAPVVAQRVEDCYFEGVDISGMRGADIGGGIYPEGSRAEGWKIYSKKSDIGETEYIPVWCCVKYRDEDNVLFLNLHY